MTGRPRVGELEVALKQPKSKAYAFRLIDSRQESPHRDHPADRHHVFPARQLHAGELEHDPVAGDPDQFAASQHRRKCAKPDFTAIGIDKNGNIYFDKDKTPIPADQIPVRLQPFYKEKLDELKGVHQRRFGLHLRNGDYRFGQGASLGVKKVSFPVKANNKFDPAAPRPGGSGAATAPAAPAAPAAHQPRLQILNYCNTDTTSVLNSKGGSFCQLSLSALWKAYSGSGLSGERERP